MPLLRFALRRGALAVETDPLELAVFFFAPVCFLGAAFFAGRFFAGDFLLEVGLDFFAFVPFFLVAICAV